MRRKKRLNQNCVSPIYFILFKSSTRGYEQNEEHITSLTTTSNVKFQTFVVFFLKTSNEPYLVKSNISGPGKLVIQAIEYM